MSRARSRWYGPDKNDPTQLLVEHLARARYEDIPADAREYAARSIMDAFGTPLAGSSALTVRKLLHMITAWGGQPEATVLVRGERVPAPNAVLANTGMARARLFDDVEEDVGDHPTVPPLYSAIAAAEMVGGCSGKEVLTAVTLASDLLLRIRYALHTETRGFAWCTEAFAPLSAAIAAGRILRFDPDQFADALGIAFMQLSSTWLMHQEGASIHHLQYGIGSRSGFFSALMAREGIDGPRRIIETEYGMVHALGAPAYDRSVLLDRLGKHYLNVNVSLKRYPASSFSCYAIDGTQDLMRRLGLSASDIQTATVFVNERAYLRACQPEQLKRHPPTVLHAQLSIPFCVAATIVRGDFFLEELTPESLRDSAIIDLAGRVRCVMDRELDKVSAVVAPVVVELRLKNKQAHSIRVEYPRGHARNPMTLDEVADKFRRCARYADPPLDKKSVDKAIAALRRLEDVPDMRRVVGYLTTSGR